MAPLRALVAGALAGTTLLLLVQMHTSRASAAEVVSADTTELPTVGLTVSLPQLATAAGGKFSISDGTDVVRPEVEQLSGGDLNLMLVFDTSGSMAGAPVAAAKTAADQLVGQLPPTAEVGVVSFSAAPTLVSPLSPDHPRAQRAIDSLTAGGETALYDALMLALDHLPPAAPGHNEVLVLSDGGDTVSRTALGAVTARLGASHVRVDVASLVTRDTNAGVLNVLASSGGGDVVPAAGPGALAGVYQRIGAALIDRYRLTFVTRAHGPTDFVVRLDGQEVATAHLDLPGVPPPHPGRPVPKHAAAGPEPGVWLLWLGGAAVFAALVLAFWALSLQDRARAIAASLRPASMRESAVSGTDRVRGTLAGAVERVLDRHDDHRRLADALERAGLRISQGELVLLVVAAAVLVAGAMAALGRPLVGVMVAAVVPLLAHLVLSVLASRRRARFCNQLVDALQLLATTLRAGYGIQQAIDAVSQQADPPISEEFHRVMVETRLGRDLSESLDAAARRMRSRDFEWVVEAVNIQRDVGGDLAGIVDTVADTIRERNQLARQVKALSAEGRISAYVLIALPFATAGVMKLGNPSYLGQLGHGVGLAMLGAGAGLIVVGALWMWKICRVVV